MACEVITVLERQRQVVHGLPSLEELAARTASGWSLVAMEWQREVAQREMARKDAASAGARVEVPYGLHVTGDGCYLEQDPREQRVLMAVMNGIVDDRPISQVAGELNRLGLTNREGAEWTAAAVFDLLPRLIESGPEIFASSDWTAQRERRTRSA